MPLYQFHIRDSDHFEDYEGVRLPDDRSAASPQCAALRAPALIAVQARHAFRCLWLA